MPGLPRKVEEMILERRKPLEQKVSLREELLMRNNVVLICLEIRRSLSSKLAPLKRSNNITRAQLGENISAND